MNLPPAEQRKLEHVQGFLELGMLDDATQAFQKIGKEFQQLPNVLAVRFDLELKLNHWEKVCQIAKHLAEMEPENPMWFVEWANAARKVKSIEVSQKILLNAEKRHPNNPAIKYNLGCYAAVLGDAELARKYVGQAVDLDRRFKKIALQDPDLKELLSP
jgi:predicted Zn-dependent protease